MKREILCTKCAKANRKLFPSDNPYPNEYVKFFAGRARKTFNCDLCGGYIVKDDDCVAFSSWHTEYGIAYYPWESNYVAKKEVEVEKESAGKS